MKIFLLRHASPDRSRRDIPYDILPGPELIPKGKQETLALAEFLKSEGLVKLYYSPFECAARTALIVAAANGIPALEEKGLAEWRGVEESESQVRARMSALFKRIASESVELGPIGLVSHGGPIAILLEELGMSKDVLTPYRKMFDTTNPHPPAGAWKVEDVGGRWVLRLAFKPNAS